MTADRLLKLYPRPWRDRYGAEFLEMIGPRALGAQQIVNIAMGAADAWLSLDVRRSGANPSVVTSDGGRAMLNTLKAACGDTTMKLTARDFAISLVVLLGGTLALSIIGIAAGRSGHPVLGDVVKSLAFPISMTVSMHFSVLKGQPWRPQTAVLSATLVMLVWASYLATLI